MTSTTQTAAAANAEAISAWDGPLYDRFVRFRHIVTTGLGAHGDEALRLYPPQPGQRVLDVGCGFGDMTQQIAELVGASGEAVGVDAAPRFIETARTERAEAGIANAHFEAVDVQAGVDGGPRPSSRGSWSDRRNTTSPPAGPGRSRWPTPTPSPTSWCTPGSATSCCTAATCRS
jgi:SAM-dependent methyltransferase